MLSIQNLEARIDNKNILNGLNLNINPGEVHAIMGPNGSGKSTLANVLSGKMVMKQKAKSNSMKQILTILVQKKEHKREYS